MRIGYAQLNTTVGDLEVNLTLGIDAYEQLSGQGVDLVVFPELFLCGYPPKDLLHKENFLIDVKKKLDEFAKQIGPTPALIGFAENNPNPSSFRKAFNSAAWCEQGKTTQIFRKQLLPTYDVFDEDRYFSPGKLPMTRNFKGKKIAVSICEDIWNVDSDLHSQNPLEQIANEKPDLLLNLSASPWHLGKQKQRIKLLGKVVKKLTCPIAYINSVGGNDELIFDGRSLAMDTNAKIINQTKEFEEAIGIYDFNEISISEVNESEDKESLRKALVLGLRDYVHKTGFSKGLIGLSGGIDSAVTAALAVEALGPNNVIGVSLPSAISSEHSKDDACKLAENLGIEYHTLPIEGLVACANQTLSELFTGKEKDVTEENLQARARGVLLMAISNKFGALLLTTGNKSELAVGYCTLYGDMCGGLAVIADVPKTQVFELARHINRHREVIPQNTIDKPPSAELRPDQKDSDSLPDYDQLDRILHAYVEKGKSIQTIIRMGHPEEIVRKIVRLVDLNEYKRKQSAPALKTTPLAFGVGRRMPIVQKYQN
jgi:NAD+ synthase (glutamine-hydrolysing)